MRTNDVDIFGSLIRKLERLNTLSQADRDAIRTLSPRIITEKSSAHLMREGDKVTHCCLLLHGFACRHKLTSGGGRQIVSFHMAGDILDGQLILFSHADHNVQAITDVIVACLPKDDLKSLASSHPAIAEALWRDALADASIFREWVLNVGRRDARSRIAHLLCEFALRYQAAGLGSPERFEFPITQEQLADATGLTSVHVNRMLRELTESGVIGRDRRLISIEDWEKMRRIADFSPDYLHAVA